MLAIPLSSCEARLLPWQPQLLTTRARHVCVYTRLAFAFAALLTTIELGWTLSIPHDREAACLSSPHASNGLQAADPSPKLPHRRRNKTSSSTAVCEAALGTGQVPVDVWALRAPCNTGRAAM